MKTTALMLAATAGLALAGCTTMDDDMSMDGRGMDGMATTPTAAATSMPRATATNSASASQSVTVGGAQMFPNQTIVANASRASNLTTLVTAVRGAGLVDTLNGPGPFTVFAPTNAAFDRLPAGALQTLTNPANSAQLRQVLQYHVVPGRITAADLKQRLQAGGGQTTIATAQGQSLTFRLDGQQIMLMGGQGTNGYVVTPDVMQSNGIVHVINGVMVPTPPGQ